MIVIDVELRAIEGARSELISLLHDTVAGSLAEPGSTIYRATASLDDPSRFHILELWESEAAYQAHRQGAALARFLEVLPTCGQVVSIKRLSGTLTPYTVGA